MSDFGVGALDRGVADERARPGAQPARSASRPAQLDAALAAGEITQARIDEAATRVINAYIGGGLFDNPLPATPVGRGLHPRSTRRSRAHSPSRAACC